MMTRLVTLGLLLAAVAGQGQFGPKIRFETLRSVEKGKWRAVAQVPRFATDGVLEQCAGPDLELALEDGFYAFVGRAHSLNQKPVPGLPRREWTYTSKVTTSVVRPDLISLLATVDTETGGAHGMEVTRPFAYGFVRGRAKRLAASDLLKAGLDPVTVFGEMVLPRLVKLDAQWVQDGTVKALTPEQCDSFVVTPSGITFLFDPYEMGPFVQGSFQVKVPFADLAEVLDPEGPLKGVAKEAAPPPDLRAVTGAATFRERVALPPGAVLRVTLLDMQVRGNPLIAEYQDQDLKGVPIRFRLAFDAKRIVADRKYALMAEIRVKDRVAWRTESAVGIDPTNPPASLEIVLTKAAD
ncbi:MAG: YbaY family lipoprotein [Fimbriimonadaceae bacterium]|nr:YbaY family lipoprotein [Fimbriimonadaceae bacterium]